jgi:hypothetical protein
METIFCKSKIAHVLYPNTPQQAIMNREYTGGLNEINSFFIGRAALPE